jgi:hypothetical protein
MIALSLGCFGSIVKRHIPQARGTFAKHLDPAVF